MMIILYDDDDDDDDDGDDEVCILCSLSIQVNLTVILSLAKEIW